MKLFVAGVSTESNTFAPMPTGLADYEVFRGWPPADRPTSFTQPFLVWQRLAAERGWEAVCGLGASAPPAGTTVRRVYEGFRDEILADLRRAGPVDAVLLNLHGAMVADGYDDCEGDLLAAVRRVVGPRVPVGVELDPTTAAAAAAHWVTIPNATTFVINFVAAPANATDNIKFTWVAYK